MGTPHRRRATVQKLALICWCLAALTAVPTAAAESAPTLTVAPERGSCGQDATLSGAGVAPGDRVTLRGPLSAATGRQLPSYRETAAVAADDGRWALTASFCDTGIGTWALVDTEDRACLVPSPPCSEDLYEVFSLPSPTASPRPGSGFDKGLRIHITYALPGLPNTGGGGLAERRPAPIGPLALGPPLLALGITVAARVRRRG